MNTKPMAEPDEVLQDAELFGKQWVEDYDIVEPFDNAKIPSTVAALAALAQGGPVLEVAAGTGRVAIPLAATGLDVSASDASLEMITALKQHDSKKLVQAYVDVLPGISGTQKYSLIYILVNSLWYLTTPEEQQHFLANAAKRLTPQGVVVVEMAVANPQRWTDAKTIAFPELTVVRTSKWSPVSQKLLQRFEISKKGHQKDIRDDLVRVIFPNELVLMAKLAGLRPRHTWSDWERTEFTTSSSTMICVFETTQRVGKP